MTGNAANLRTPVAGGQVAPGVYGDTNDPKEVFVSYPPDPIDWGVLSDPKTLDALNNSPLVRYGKARREWLEGGCVGPTPVPPRNVGLYTQEFGRGKRKS